MSNVLPIYQARGLVKSALTLLNDPTEVDIDSVKAVLADALAAIDKATGGPGVPTYANFPAHHEANFPKVEDTPPVLPPGLVLNAAGYYQYRSEPPLPQGSTLEYALDHVRRVKARDANEDANDQRDGTLYKDAPIPPSIYPDDEATMWALHVASMQQMDVGPGGFFYQLVAGTRSDRGKVVDWAYDDVRSQPWKQNKGYGYLAEYAGPYKSIIDAFLAAHRR